jgi:hypothetical protein
MAVVGLLKAAAAFAALVYVLEKLRARRVGDGR